MSVCARASRGQGWELCPKYGITAPLIDFAVWERVEKLLTNPEVIAGELAKRHSVDPTEADLAAVDRAVAEVLRKQRNLVQNLALVSGSAATLLAVELDDLEVQVQRLNRDRETILQRRQAWEEAEQQLSTLESWCREVASRLHDLSYEGKRMALAALGVRVHIWRSDHDPRWEIRAEIPLDGQHCVQSFKRRASLHVVRDEAALDQFERGGLEVLEATLDEFRAVLLSESHTLKRALIDPTLISGVGNAYSDEILHRAGLSPVRLTRQLREDEVERLYHAIRATFTEWVDRLRAEVGDGFPKKVTAFHPAMAVHGKYRRPCPTCGAAVQRIVYAENECNYCPSCQTGGRLLADRALSRLLKGDWPRTPEEMEQRLAGANTSRTL